MDNRYIQINAKLQSYTKGMFPSFPQPTQFDIGKVLGVNENGQYALIDQSLTKQQADEIIRKLSTIEEGAQQNKIEKISINGRQLQITGKQVNIEIATTQNCGVVKSSNLENYVFVHQTGQMEVNDINISKITQHEGQDIILECSDIRR